MTLLAKKNSTTWPSKTAQLRFLTWSHNMLPLSLKSNPKLMPLTSKLCNLTSTSPRLRRTVRKLLWVCALSWPLTSTINQATTASRSLSSRQSSFRPKRTVRKLLWVSAPSWPLTSKVNKATTPSRLVSSWLRSTTKEHYLLSKRKLTLNKSFWSVSLARKLSPSRHNLRWRSTSFRISTSRWMESSPPRRSPTKVRFRPLT